MSSEMLCEGRPGRGEFVAIEETFEYVVEVGHSALVEFGMRDADAEGFFRMFGFYLQRAAFGGEEDVGEGGFGGDGQVVQPAPPEAGYCGPPRDKMPGLSGAGQIRRN